jgi:hypothetical protein
MTAIGWSPNVGSLTRADHAEPVAPKQPGRSPAIDGEVGRFATPRSSSPMPTYDAHALARRHSSGGLTSTDRPQKEPAMRPDPALADVRGRLRQRFADQPRNVVDETVDDVEAEFSGATVRAFLPVLVERRAAARLQELSRT